MKPKIMLGMEPYISFDLTIKELGIKEDIIIGISGNPHFEWGLYR